MVVSFGSVLSSLWDLSYDDAIRSVLESEDAVFLPPLLCNPDPGAFGGNFVFALKESALIIVPLNFQIFFFLFSSFF
jgi:hypothetical protein